MKIPLSWISLYTPLAKLLEKHDTKSLAHEYSIHTAEIDGIEEHFLDKVVVGKVISCEKHPESKKLSIVKVALGEHGEETILTGAANIAGARYVAVAIVGAILPGDFHIGERMMAGMMSRGMICGADEIGMSTEESTGIMILEQDWDEKVLEKMLGKSFFDLSLPFPGKDGEIYNYPLRDVTFEIDNKFITNRPDLFSVVGNAREFHAVFQTPPLIEEAGRGTPSHSPYKGENSLDTHIETKNCLSYHLMKMDGITVGKSPWGIALMMERAGLGPKMDIVDITNLIMTELGQPMHAFDADKIVGDISVRQAKKGEKILALNNTEYELTPDDMVIADEKGPVAIAGVIGGIESAVSESTKNIIWESACFDATAVRLTAQRHGIRTDASTRYEKSLDPLLAGSTFPRVVEYMKFLGKDIQVTGTSSYLDESRVNHISIDIDYSFIDMKAGIAIPKEEVSAILERLGFGYIVNDTSLKITVPSWRASKDVNIKEDIAEEVARMYGYDQTPLTPLSANFRIATKNHEITLRDLSLEHFAGKNYHEVYGYSFTSEALDRQIGLTDMDDAIGIQNAFNEEYTHMRRSLAPRLLMATAENLKYSDHFGFFEIGKVYSKNSTKSLSDTLLESIKIKPYNENKKITGVLVGGSLEEFRKTLETYLERAIGFVPPVHTGTSHALFHPGISGAYMEGDATILAFGELHPSVATSFGLPEGVLYFDGDYEEILREMQDRDTRFHSISKYQTISRELNFVMKSNTPTGDVARIIDAVHPWIEGVHVDSVYEDASKLGEGMKSVSFAFTLSNHDATISDEEALSVQNMVIEKMKERGYNLRG